MAFLTSISANQTSDETLVQQYKQSGDQQILATLFQRYLDLLYGVCLKYLKEPETAKDAVMHLFEELVVKLRKHDVDRFKPWLHAVAKNYCLMQLRKHKNYKIKEFDANVMQSEDDVHLNGMMEEQLVKMEKCMQVLPPDQKVAIELFYLQNKCYQEIVDITGLDWNKVRSHIQNGRRNLKICMSKDQ